MPVKKQNKAQSARSLLLGSNDERKKIVSIDHNGQKIDVELRVMSIGELEKIRKKTGMNFQNSNQGENFSFLIWSVISSCYSPETGEPLFEEADYDSFLELRVDNTWFGKLAMAVAEFTGGGGSPEANKKSVKG